MKNCLFIFVFLAGILVSAQSSYELSAVEKFPLKADRYIGTDSFGDVYFVHNRTLHKKSGAAVYEFQDFQLGALGNVDLLNPLKITVFYPDFNTAVILDNKLSEVQRINFALQPPFINAVHATTANDNRLWIFNLDTQQLELYNYRNASRQVLSRPLPDDYIIHKSNFNFCYVLAKDKLRLYNIYGSLLQSIPNDNYTLSAQNNDRVVLKNEQVLLLITENLTKTHTLNLKEIDAKDLYLTDEFLYIYDGEFVYKMKLIKTGK